MEAVLTSSPMESLYLLDPRGTGDTPPFGINTFSQTEHKVMGTGNKAFASGSLEMPLHFHPLIPRPMNPGYRKNSTIHWTVIQVGT